MKYQFITDNRGSFSVVRMARYLQISVRSYYDWLSGKTRRREKQSLYLKDLISTVFEKSECTYGADRISAELQMLGEYLSSHTVSKYMRQMGLRSILAPAFKPTTTDSKHNNNIAENILNREFNVTSPNVAWVSDITYMPTTEGFIYLTTVIDLFDRKVIGWSISSDMTAEETVIKAFKMAVKNRYPSGKPDLGLIFHSDRGSQYTCNEFIKLLDKYNIRRSNSRKGNCWDNAVAESFFKTLKAELKRTLGKEDREKTEERVFRFIEGWYNRNRRHSALENLTIEEFWQRYLKIEKNLNVA